jgi:hypothetical protein
LPRPAGPTTWGSDQQNNAEALSRLNVKHPPARACLSNQSLTVAPEPTGCVVFCRHLSKTVAPCAATSHPVQLCRVKTGQAPTAGYQPHLCDAASWDAAVQRGIQGRQRGAQVGGRAGRRAQHLQRLLMCTGRAAPTSCFDTQHYIQRHKPLGHSATPQRSLAQGGWHGR